MDALFPRGEAGTPLRPDMQKLLGQGGPPIDEVKDASYAMNGGMMLDELESSSMRAMDSQPVSFGNLNKADNVEINNWLDTVQGEFKDASAASRKFAEVKRDMALLNYRERYHYDNTIGIGMPYAFWMTHSMQKWALRSLDAPAMATTYMRFRKGLETMGAPKEGFPSRLKNSIKLPLFNPPSWLGNKYFVNPMQLALPFDQMLYPWEQRERRNSMDSRRASEAIQQMVQAGEVTTTQGQQAMAEQKGEIWELAHLRLWAETSRSSTVCLG